jgi:rhodanese-related sulfurtransferase
MADLIHPDNLHRLRQFEPAPTVIDVRGAEEYAAGHLPGALHIPGDELPARLAEIPRDRPVVTY